MANLLKDLTDVEIKSLVEKITGKGGIFNRNAAERLLSAGMPAESGKLPSKMGVVYKAPDVQDTIVYSGKSEADCGPCQKNAKGL